MRTKLFILSSLISFTFLAQAQEISNGVMRLNELRKPTYREIINIPEMNGYQVLKCDFHAHTVFSDGHVWPNVRAQEAWEEGLDAMALTEHVENQSYKDYIEINRNRSHELIEVVSKKNNVILIKGAEITRLTPPGHFNAVFIGDASSYVGDKDSEKDFEAVMGTSDIHNLIGHDYDRSRKYVHRTMTLVMAKERTPESIREALDAGRTVAWASKYLAGKEENVKNLFNACVKLMPSHYSQEKNGVRTNFYEIQNKSDLYFELELTSGKGTQKITLYPMSSQLLSAEAGQQSLSYDVTNAYVRSDKFLNISFSL